MTLTFSTLTAQYQGIYVSESDPNTFININRGDIEIYHAFDICGAEDILERSLLLKSLYRTENDTLFLTQNGAEFCIHMMSEDVIQIKSGINPSIKMDTKFYCIRKYDESGRVVYFGKWKAGQRTGDWLFISDEGYRTKVTYENGKEISRTSVDR